MAKYYYGVKKGREIGVYETWGECEAQVKGYSGAVYKKFPTYEEAENFVYNIERNVEEKDMSSIKENEAIAYVDGSFDATNKIYSYGVILFTTEGKFTYSQKEDDKNLVAMRNVAGEIRGAMVAMKEAINMNKDVLYLHYDYEGIEKWAKGEWKTNKYGTQKYKEYYDSIKDILKVKFIKVKAHSGDKYNEEADKLAKASLGIED
ncbi:ribonuclease HI [Keratinibaculum paraultunense]|uniref:ribonuclease H n=1 Tax=Keratinibaculum paraultunense TaxID=1278232 RepID=A0A4R3KST9_9FIRM|nr:ribonuclease H family protein [Keratinibaculum paraultunense]QQY79520.1 ribonuclease H family protein [Keratinibaculum paraultunense]TCS87985.1 ribonuclease HI [Keratinibaculum paraultunense]